MKEEMRRVERSTMQLSTDVIRDLQLFKTAYNIYFAEEIDGETHIAQISMSQMLRRWMDNVGSFDPEIKRMFDNAKEIK